jgi:hypothetical protein
MTIRNDFGACSEIPDRLDKLFHEAGKVRKFELQMRAMDSITKENRLSRPVLFLEHLKSSKKKSDKKLQKKRRSYATIKMREFVTHSNIELSSRVWRQFLAARASSILDLLEKDIISDFRSLHQLRKILKSIVYVLPLCKNKAEPARVFLKTRKEFIKSVESKIGSVHDTRLFVDWLEKKQKILHSPEKDVLKKIMQEWENDITGMKEDLQPLLAPVRQFALGLRDQSADILRTVRM